MDNYSKLFFSKKNDKKVSDGNLLLEGYPLTKIGLLVRKTSLDELPQLFNVLKKL
jgi:undecaprenyl phosphate N,N'-diacetylbacillosamine 1-phosphate transferase